VNSRELLLECPELYLLSQGILGGKKARKRCIQEYAYTEAGMRVLDLGCGPGYIIEYLPRVCYHGFDINARYIEYARRKYGELATFSCQNFDRAVTKIWVLSILS
jgi:SAM-dependent methyltransferase